MSFPIADEKGELKIGCSGNYKERLNSSKTWLKNGKFLAIYVFAEKKRYRYDLNDTIFDMETIIKKKTAHLETKYFGTEFRKITFDELDKIYVDTLKENNIDFECIKDNILFKINTNNKIPTIENCLDRLFHYAYFDMRSIIKKFEKYNDIEFLKGKSKSQKGIHLWEYSHPKKKFDDDELLKQKLEICNKKKYNVIYFRYVTEHWTDADYYMLIFDNGNKKIHLCDPYYCDNITKKYESRQTLLKNYITQFIQSLNYYKNYDLSNTNNDLITIFSQNKIIYELSNNENTMHIFGNTHYKTPEKCCCFYYLHKIANNTQNEINSYDMLEILLMYTHYEYY